MTGRRAPLVVVGDTLLDRDIDGEATRLAPDAPAPVVDIAAEHSRPGGAGLAAALAVAADGREVVLVTPLGSDDAARTVRDALCARGVRLVELPLRGTIPVKTRVRAAGRPLVRLDHGGGTPGAPEADVRRVIEGAAALLVADYGRGTTAVLGPLLAAAARRVPLLWDPHPRGQAPVPGTRLATPSAAEARTFAAALPHPDGVDGEDSSLRAHTARAARLARYWQAAAVAVTLGERGVLLARGGSPMLIPPPHTAEGDPCGAGDALAAAAARALADGALPEEALQQAVAAAAAFVAGGGVAAPALWRSARHPSAAAGPATADAVALAAAVRARGGTVVATGGCFDLLHAGHVGLLESARGIGDCLIVCLNSDASVRRLKGPGRPLNPAADRATVLAGLGCVDAVAVFEEDTPEPLLRTLRPHVWVKGGDYTPEDLPEAAALAAWGGQAVVLPYLDGRSTTELARRAAGVPR